MWRKVALSSAFMKHRGFSWKHRSGGALKLSDCKLPLGIFLVHSIGIYPYFDMGKHTGSVRLGHVQKIVHTMYSKNKTDLLRAQSTCSYIIAHHRTSYTCFM